MDDDDGDEIPIDAAPPNSWSNEPWVIVTSLIFLWPVGMSLLMRSRWPLGWNKALLSVVTLPLFVAWVALLLWLSPFRIAPDAAPLR